MEHKLEEHLRIKKVSVTRKTGNIIEIKIDVASPRSAI
jgi:hypothetical protein